MFWRSFWLVLGIQLPTLNIGWMIGKQFPVDTLSSYDNIVKARADVRAAIRALRAEALDQKPIPD